MATTKAIAENLLLELQALNSGLTDVESLRNLMREFVRDATELAELTLGKDRVSAARDTLATIKIQLPPRA